VRQKILSRRIAALNQAKSALDLAQIQATSQRLFEGKAVDR